MRPTIRILTTGGTIASELTSGSASVEKPGSELIREAPELEDIATIESREIFNRGSVAIDRTALEKIGHEARNAESDGIDGVVVTHGTDTMEETAYFLDLSLNLDIPILITGAQRSANQTSADGPGNILLACHAAANADFAGQGGVYIAMNDEIHAARYVTKTHTTAVGTFKSPEYGPIASLNKNEFRFLRPPGSYSAHIPVLSPEGTVAMIISGIDVGRISVDSAIANGVDGIVIQGTGVGNVAPKIADAMEDAIAQHIPVVITTRCHAGSTVPVYGGPSGSKTLHENGAILGGDLPTHKARIKLLLAINHVDAENELRRLFRPSSWK